jgi:hypothetical protein
MCFLAFAVEPADLRNPALDRLGLAMSLLCTAGAAAGLAVCGLALNDVLDRRVDRAMGRPRGESVWQLPAAVGGLLLATACAGVLGPASLGLAIGLGAGVLFYNLVARFVPGVGIVTLGLVQAVAMALPNPQAGFAWPVLLTLSHVMASGLIRHSLESKRPRLSARGVWGVLMGWGFWSLVVLVLMRSRTGGQLFPQQGEVWVLPGLAAAAFAVLTWRLLRSGKAGEGRDRVRRFRRLSVSWLLVYAAAWLGGLGLIGPAILVMALLGAAWCFALGEPAGAGPGG